MSIKVGIDSKKVRKELSINGKKISYYSIDAARDAGLSRADSARRAPQSGAQPRVAPGAGLSTPGGGGGHGGAATRSPGPHGIHL